MKIEHRELDRLLCERAGIVGEVVHDYHDCDLETFDWGNPWRNRSPECTCSPSKEYPAVSTDGNAMLSLLAALRKDGKFVNRLEDSSEDARECWQVVIERSEVETMGPLPLAVALAAAKAWGIEVPVEEGE